MKVIFLQIYVIFPYSWQYKLYLTNIHSFINNMDYKYADLSVLADKAIDVGFLLSKLKGDGYNTFALDYEFTDDAIFKPNVQISTCRSANQSR